jgi:hypothetical protein
MGRSVKKVRLGMTFYLARGDAEADAMSSLLGYVFWHRPRPGVSLRAYERRLLVFQSSLKGHPPDGLIDALSFREGASPWSKRRSTTYEDWYLVRGFQSLGTLNDAAVADPNKGPHDEVARDASGGAAGVYRLLGGDFRLQDALFATWISKPPRTPYQTFLHGLAKLVGDRKTDLWQRQMVLGRAPEFCVHSERPLELPRSLRATTMRLRLLAETKP